MIGFSVTHTYDGPDDDVTCSVTILTEGGNKIYQAITRCSSEVSIRGAKLWWPRFSHAKPGYLYTFEVSLKPKSVSEGSSAISQR